MDYISVPPAQNKDKIINNFSTQDKVLSKNIEIIDNGDGTENLSISFNDKILTFVVDNSGSMSWNDSSAQRYQIIKEFINFIEVNYNGNVFYNLITFGASYLSCVLFASVYNENIGVADNIQDVFNIGAIPSDVLPVRVVRNVEREIDGVTYTYPRSPSDGEVVVDGFLNAVEDADLEEGVTYYYTIYTYTNQDLFSRGINICIAPQQKEVPRGISNFLDLKETGETVKGYGVRRDENTLVIWHLDEAVGDIGYDFEGDLNVLLYNTYWINEINAPAGISGLNFRDDSSYAISQNNNISLIHNGQDAEKTVMFWIRPVPVEIGKVGDVNQPYFILYQMSADDSNPEICFGISYFVENEDDMFVQLLIHLSDNLTYKITSSDLIEQLQFNLWSHVSVNLVYDSLNILNEESSKIFINGNVFNIEKFNDGEIFSGEVGEVFFGGIKEDNNISIYNGSEEFLIKGMIGDVSEISIHSINRDDEYISSQLKYINNIPADSNNYGIDIENEVILKGLDEDNGDRISILKYFIPFNTSAEDCDVLVVRKRGQEPTWEEDGVIVYQEKNQNISSGWNYFVDNNSFIIGENYYYKIYTINQNGIFSYAEDSAIYFVSVPFISSDETKEQLAETDSDIPSSVINEALILGDEKLLLKWEQVEDIGFEIVSTKIFVSNSSYPYVDNFNNYTGEKIAVLDVNDNEFVYNNIKNDINYYFTIVNEDRYGIVSQPVYLLGTPLIEYSSNNNLFPIKDIERIKKEIIDKNTISLYWDSITYQRQDISTTYDKSIIIYSYLQDIYGNGLFTDNISLEVIPFVAWDEKAEDIFSDVLIEDVDVNDIYTFFTEKKENGLVVGTLSLTNNPQILAKASKIFFQFQIKSEIPNLNYLRTDLETDLEKYKYSDVIPNSQAIVNQFQNIYEYSSPKISIEFTNPWEIELINRDQDFVEYICFYYEEGANARDVLRKMIETFNGKYVGTSSPFYIRAKVLYKGEPVPSGRIEIAIWDAEVDKCSCTGVDGVCEPSFSRIQPTQSIDYERYHTIQRGTETKEVNGEIINEEISFVDIPVYSPKIPRNFILYAKSEFGGYNSVAKMNFVFESTFRAILDANNVSTNGVDISPQKAEFYFLDPDYPEDETKYIFPFGDSSVASWELNFLYADEYGFAGGTEVFKETNVPQRQLYSEDALPLSEGLYTQINSDGNADDVYFGPVANLDAPIIESYEIKITSNYRGMQAEDRKQIKITHAATEDSSYNRRFFMQIENGYKGQNSLWTDGQDYIKLYIAANVEIATDLKDVSIFEDCLDEQSFTTVRLGRGQVVELTVSNILEFISEEVDLTNIYNNVEFLWGEGINERVDETGKRILETSPLTESSFGSAEVELDYDDDNEIMPIYIRLNQQYDGEGCVKSLQNTDCEDINLSCLDLTTCDVSQMGNLFIRGETFANIEGNLVKLIGGGDPYTGVPPCGICLSDPLKLSFVWTRVDDEDTPELGYFYDGQQTLLDYNSKIDVRLKISFAGSYLPEDENVYVKISEENRNSLFVANQNIVPVKTSEDNKFSYVDVSIFCRDKPVEKRTSFVEFFVDYNKVGDIQRYKSLSFSLTVDVPQVDEPEIDESETVDEADDDSAPLFSKKIYEYDIIAESWIENNELLRARANYFISDIINDNIYIVGGRKGQSSSDIISTIEVYDRINNEIDSLRIEGSEDVFPELNIPRYAGMSATYQNNLFTIGGIEFDEKQNALKISSEIEVIDFVSGDVESFVSLPKPIAYGSALIYNSYLYIFNGITNATISNRGISSEEFNTSIFYINLDSISSGWEEVEIVDESKFNYKRLNGGCFNIDNICYLFGGVIKDGDGEYNSQIIEYGVNLEDIDNNFAVNKINENIELQGFGSVVIDNVLYIIGGHNVETLRTKKKVLKGDTTSENINLETSEALSVALRNITVKGNSNKIYVFGGNTSGNAGNIINIT